MKSRKKTLKPLPRKGVKCGYEFPIKQLVGIDVRYQAGTVGRLNIISFNSSSGCLIFFYCSSCEAKAEPTCQCSGGSGGTSSS